MEAYLANESFSGSFDLSDATKMYLQEISKIPILSKEQETDLLLKIAQGDEDAKQLFTESNLRLVVYVAKKYPQPNLELIDLIQEGSHALITAIETYDLNSSVSFTSYAYVVIKNEIIRKANIYNQRNSGIMCSTYSKYLKAREKLTKLHGQNPSVSEIAAEIDMDPEKLQAILMRYKPNIVSLNQNLGDSQASELHEFISSDIESLEEEAIDEMFAEQLNYCIYNSGLDEREIEVINYCFGINSHPILSLAEIGLKYGISYEMVRKIREKALDKLRDTEFIKPMLGAKEIKITKKRSIKSIYQILKCTEEEFTFLQSQLANCDIDLLNLLYINGYENGAKVDVSCEQYTYFRRDLIPFMSRKLEKIRNVFGNRPDFFQIITKAYFNVNPESFSLQDLLIVCLKYGYIDGIYYSAKKIAKILDLDYSEVVQICLQISTNEISLINEFISNITEHLEPSMKLTLHKV